MINESNFYWFRFYKYLLVFNYFICCFFIGGVIALKEAKNKNIDEEFMINLFFYIVVFGLIGARLYYCVFNLDYYMLNPIDILKIWEGGLAIHGGLIFALIVVIIYSKKYNIKTLRVLDILSVSLILGQAIGRWGNFMNGEAHGPITTLKHLQDLHIPQFIIDGMNIGGNYYMPTFLYESLLCLIGFIILYIYRKLKYTKVGGTTSLYLIIYGVIRIIIESFRTDSLMLGNIKMAQVVSIIMIISGIVLFIKTKKGSIFDNRYAENDTEMSKFV